LEDLLVTVVQVIIADFAIAIMLDDSANPALSLMAK